MNLATKTKLWYVAGYGLVSVVLVLLGVLTFKSVREQYRIIGSSVEMKREGNTFPVAQYIIELQSFRLLLAESSTDSSSFETLKARFHEVKESGRRLAMVRASSLVSELPKYVNVVDGAESFVAAGDSIFSQEFKSELSSDNIGYLKLMLDQVLPVTKQLLVQVDRRESEIGASIDGKLLNHTGGFESLMAACVALFSVAFVYLLYLHSSRLRLSGQLRTLEAESISRQTELMRSTQNFERFNEITFKTILSHLDQGNTRSAREVVIDNYASAATALGHNSQETSIVNVIPDLINLWNVSGLPFHPVLYLDCHLLINPNSWARVVAGIIKLLDMKLDQTSSSVGLVLEKIAAADGQESQVEVKVSIQQSVGGVFYTKGSLGPPDRLFLGMTVETLFTELARCNLHPRIESNHEGFDVLIFRLPIDLNAVQPISNEGKAPKRGAMQVLHIEKNPRVREKVRGVLSKLNASVIEDFLTEDFERWAGLGNVCDAALIDFVGDIRTRGIQIAHRLVQVGLCDSICITTASNREDEEVLNAGFTPLRKPLSVVALNQFLFVSRGGDSV